jgi:uncharacterized coiled-coil DUF342 family protein
VELSEQVRTELSKLNRSLASLQQQLDLLNKKAEHWAEKRNAIHTQIKDLRSEAAKARDLRNAANAKAKAWKRKRNQTRALLTKKKEESRQLKRTLQRLNAKKPKRTVEAIRREKEQIEWRIQTSSLTLQEEKLLVEQVNQLETQLSIYEEIDNTSEKIRELQDQMEKMNAAATLSHTGVLDLAQRSQQFHQKTLKATEKIKALQVDADAFHQKFVQSRRKRGEIYAEYLEVKQRNETIKKEKAEKEEKEKREHREDARKQIKAKAQEKLERGEKLTWEEFKLLTDQPT